MGTTSSHKNTPLSQKAGGGSYHAPCFTNPGCVLSDKTEKQGWAMAHLVGAQFPCTG